ncbi:MAG: DUF2922 domain-containing protein [Sarcina sp.]
MNPRIETETMDKQVFSLALGFKNAQGKTTVITIDNCKEDITKAEAITCMDALLKDNIIVTSGGDLVSKVSARLIVKAETDLGTL